MKKQRLQSFRGGILLFGLLSLMLASTYAQQPLRQQSADPPVEIVEMRQADLLSKRDGFDAQIFTGNVVFYHEGAFMYCDSAYLYQQANSFEAFSNVRMEQGDTIFVYGDYLHYDGNIRLARLRDNIRMEDRTATLFTDSLDYDRTTNLGYYFDGGMLVDEKNELTSYWGQYSPDTKVALFNDSVKLVNEDYIIYADTLKYNTESKFVDILGPSRIVSDSGYVHTSKGWYNTVTDDSKLLDRSEVYSNDGTKVLIGDTILYNRQTGQGEVFGDMFLEDKAQKAILRGNYGYYDEKTEYGMATDKAYAIDYSQGDSLYVHGDTLIMKTDSIYRDVKAFYNVRFYRSDLQGVCDSLHYASADSILYMIGDPVIWSDNNQILGNRIDVFLNDSTIEKAIVRDYALAIQERMEKDQFNQLSGRDMTAFFRDGELYHVLVEGDAVSLYYAMQEDSTIIGLNRMESAYLEMDTEKNRITKLKTYSATSGVMTPLPLLKPEETRLKEFVWLNYLRPTGPDDIFRRNERRSSEATEPRRGRFEREDVTL
ncbi:OstA-like protein [Porphyromonadaceae bacterium NLAE-zl-C104]|uniref:OstA-like protein n=1 Tax=Proteiniphilum TaxID=294702 RepID=UPI0008E132D7|nr:MULTISPECIES: OstA-like protein [Proteiniphilum]MDY9919930.1 OstA-like protein [Proteiniphilum sp.]SFS99904.1 OstA-like protein [Porphyromonadaceae bacterium NLAE-zl-C104]